MDDVIAEKLHRASCPLCRGDLDGGEGIGVGSLAEMNTNVDDQQLRKGEYVYVMLLYHEYKTSELSSTQMS